MTSRTPVVTVLALSALLTVQTPAQAQGPGTENGQWTYLGGDAWHTRYTTGRPDRRLELRAAQAGVAVRRLQLSVRPPRARPGPISTAS